MKTKKFIMVVLSVIMVMSALCASGCSIKRGNSLNDSAPDIALPAHEFSYTLSTKLNTAISTITKRMSVAKTISYGKATDVESEINNVANSIDTINEIINELSLLKPASGYERDLAESLNLLKSVKQTLNDYSDALNNENYEELENIISTLESQNISLMGYCNSSYK